MSPTVRDGRGRREVYAVDLAPAVAGPIERRVAGDDERGGFAPRRPSPGLPGGVERHLTEPPPAPRSPTPAPRRSPSARTCPHGLYGDVRCYVCDPLVPSRPAPAAAFIRVADPPVTPEEPTAMAIEPPESLPVVVTNGEPEYNRDALVGLQIATTEALDALAGLEAARHAEVRWLGACKALEAAWRQTGLRGGPTSIDDAIDALKLGVELGRADVARDPEPIVPDTTPEPDIAGAATALGITERQVEDLIEADVLRPITSLVAEPADDAPEVVTRPPGPAAQMANFAAERAARAAGGGPGKLGSTKQDRILAAIVPNRGDLKAIAAACNTTPGNVSATLHNAGKRKRLTVEMMDVLPAGFAKYSAAS
jgi:hypothetical protein